MLGGKGWSSNAWVYAAKSSKITLGLNSLGFG